MLGFFFHLVFKELQDVCGLGQRPDGTGRSGLGFKGEGHGKQCLSLSSRNQESELEIK